MRQTRPKRVTLTKDFVVRALAEEIRKQTGGIANVDLIEIEGVVDDRSPPFAITAIQLTIMPAPTTVAAPPPVRGKLRLAAFEGVTQ